MDIDTSFPKDNNSCRKYLNVNNLEETNVTVKSELDEQFGCLQTSLVEVTARLMKLTDMREGIVFQFGDAEVALKQETNAYFEDQNAEMTERFEKLVQITQEISFKQSFKVF